MITVCFDKPITIQVQDPNTEEWTDALHLHAEVNKNTISSGAKFTGGADQYLIRYTFTFRYCEALTRVAFNIQPFRIVYRGRHFKVTDYDDYKEQHNLIRLAGEMYE